MKNKHMTNSQRIEAARQARLTWTQVVVPTVAVIGGTALANNPELRQEVSNDVATLYRKTKNGLSAVTNWTASKIKNVFNKD